MKRVVRRLLISIAIGAGMLYLASRQLSFSGMWEAMLAADWSVLAPFAGCMASQHFFRAWRWGQLLAPIAPVPFSRILPISSVGFFAILALPLRMGEFVRPYLIADPPHIRMSHGLGTMAIERVLDGLILSLSAFLVVMAARAQGRPVPSWIGGAGLLALALFVAALVVLIMTLWQRERAVTLCHRLFSLVSARLADRATHVAEGIVDGLLALPSARRLGTFVLATLAYWTINAVALWVLSQGFQMGLSAEGAIGLQALISIGIMIPAGPAFVGNFELFGQGALSMYVDKTVLARRGGAFIVALHASNALWYIATGVIAMFSSHVSFKRVISAPTDASTVAVQQQDQG